MDSSQIASRSVVSRALIVYVVEYRNIIQPAILTLHYFNLYLITLGLNFERVTRKTDGREIKSVYLVGICSDMKRWVIEARIRGRT